MVTNFNNEEKKYIRNVLGGYRATTLIALGCFIFMDLHLLLDSAYKIFFGVVAATIIIFLITLVVNKYKYRSLFFMINEMLFILSMFITMVAFYVNGIFLLVNSEAAHKLLSYMFVSSSFALLIFTLYHGRWYRKNESVLIKRKMIDYDNCRLVFKFWDVPWKNKGKIEKIIIQKGTVGVYTSILLFTAPVLFFFIIMSNLTCLSLN